MDDARPVTAGDVAAAAGVSLATVDRVLNGRPGVRESTVRAVETAVERLGFRRDLSAANLARGRRYAFRFLLPELPGNSFVQALRREVDVAALRGMDGLDGSGGRVAVTVESYAAADSRDLARRLVACRGRGLAGVAAVAVDGPEVRDAVARLDGDGVPVVTLVSDAVPSRRACFVGPDNVAAGRVAASLLGRFVGGRAGRVLTVASRMTLRDHAERRLGFAQVIERDFPRLSLLPVAEGLDDGAVTRRIVEEALAAVPDLVGLYSLGAGNRGIVAALDGAGRSGDVIAIGHELTPSMREALLSGTFDAALDQDPAEEVRQVLRVLRALADAPPRRGAEADPGPTRITVFLKDNLP